MSIIATAYVHGTPKAQPRPKMSHRGRSIESPLGVELIFYLPRPKVHQGARGLRHSAPRAHIKKPDVDNLAKAVLDALSEKGGIGLWKDDSQVVDLIVRKRWADDRPPGAQVTISA